MAINKNYKFWEQITMFKKTAIAALVLGFTGAASAAMYAPAPAPSCAAGNVTVPCEKSAWDLGVDALYMRSEDNRLSNVSGFRAKYGLGFRLEGSYHFGTGNDATVTWSHAKKTTSDTINANAISMTNTLDVVDFELAQVVNFGENVNARFNGGFEYISVKNDSSNSLPITTPALAAGAHTGKVSGFGPRVGVLTNYDFGNGFAMYGDVNAAVLVGKSDVTISAVSSTAYGTMVSTDANMGMKYTHSMAQGDLTTRLAWGVRQMNLNSTIHGWDGFTLGMKWVGNA
jgi:hypothetical protein